MSRLLVAFALVVMAVGCSAGAVPTEEPRSLSAPTESPAPAPTPTPALTSTPTPTPPASPTAWPEGVVAYPTGSTESPLGYLEYLPPGYGDGPPRPLLVFLHGSGEAGRGTEADLELVDANGVPAMIASGDWPDDRPFVVLSPQYGTLPASGKCEIADELAAFIDYAIKHYDVDPARVYLTGISCGAIAIWDYLAETTDNTVAAVVSISGHPSWAMEKAGCDVPHVPIWMFHGALDDIVPVDFVEEKVDELRSCADPPPNELKLTIYADADHDAWTRTYDLSAGHDTYAWLLKHERN